MRDSSKERATMTAGMDLGDRYTHLCLLDTKTGEIVEEGRIRTTAQAFEARFGDAERLSIAIEAGTHSPWVFRLLAESGHEVVVANPRKTRLIHSASRKNDRMDAEKLARLLRSDRELLYPIVHRGEDAQAHLALIRSREALVLSRVRLINHVRGAVKSFGRRLPKCSSATFHKKAPESLPEELEEALSPVLETIASLTKTIAGYERRIEEIAEESYPESASLRQVSGVGTLTALVFMLTIEDPQRFAKSRSVGAYLGLVPGQDQSGGSDPQRRITKEGDEATRRLLVSSAHYILGPFGEDSDLRRHGQKLMATGGKRAKKRAVVAVARKLSVLLHRLWLTGEVYDPLRNTRPPSAPGGLRSERPEGDEAA
jgi:transposase